MYGGFSVAMIVRSAGLESSSGRPVSLACQFVRPLLVNHSVDIGVIAVRKGRSSELLRVSLMQSGKLAVEALMRTSSATEGPECSSRSLDLGDPFSLRPTREFTRKDGWERDPADLKLAEGRGNGVSTEADHLYWLRFNDGLVYDDPFVEGARIAFALDDQGPAVLQRLGYMWGPKRKELPWGFTNLDMLVHFHKPRGTDWLCSVSDVTDGHNGIASAQSQVWSRTGELLATGLSQIAFFPRPG